MAMTTSIIRKPRYWLSKKGPRFKGFRIGQTVWYDRGRTLEQYVITGFDDFYESCGGRRTENPRKDYYICIETRPIKPKRMFNPLLHRPDFDVMIYNRKLGKSGHIGHSVDSTELFHTLGEALFSCFR